MRTVNSRVRFGPALVGAAFILAAVPAGAAEWYVAPDGRAANPGTKQSPWDAASALEGRQPVKPGDTVYLRGGVYRQRPAELFPVKLTGAEGQPVHVRPAPGERARIDGGLSVQAPSAHVWLWELELFVSEPRPDKPIGPGSHPKDLNRPWGGLHASGDRHCKFLNLVIHDCSQGVSWWTPSTDGELHGCLIYDNGWLATDRGHGHAVYTQNRDGTKTISDNIMTGGFGYTVHAYGSSRADVDNFLLEGNVCYDANTFLVGGDKPSRHIRVFRNYFYGVPMRIGYGAPYNEDCEVRDNVIANADLTVKKYKQAVSEGNVIVAKGAGRPAEPQVVFRPNQYDPNRAHVAVFNWRKSAAVPVRPGAFLKKGEAFRLMIPRDFFGKPVLAGAYDGEAIAAPTPGEFAAFVLLKGAGPGR